MEFSIFPVYVTFLLKFYYDYYSYDILYCITGIILCLSHFVLQNIYFLFVF